MRVSPTLVDAISAADSQQIHSVKRPFVKSKWYADFIPGDNNLVNVQDVEIHRRHRRLLSSPLSESNLKSALPLVEETVRFAIKQLKDEMETRGATDVLKWWTCLATDTIGELTFGESFRMLETGEVNIPEHYAAICLSSRLTEYVYTHRKTSICLTSRAQQRTTQCSGRSHSYIS